MAAAESNSAADHGRSAAPPVSYWRGPKAWLMHGILGGVGFFFLVPLIWMAATSLKPLEQTMEVPPRVLPYGTLATLQSRRMLVNRAPEPIGYDGHIVRLQADLPGAPPLNNQRRQVDPASFSTVAQPMDGIPLPVAQRIGPQPPDTVGFARIETKMDGKTVFRWLPAVVEHAFRTTDYSVTEVRAAADYAAVTDAAPKDAGNVAVKPLEWDVLPKEALEEQIRPMWENYPASLQRMNFWQYLLNTVFVCGMTVAGIVVSSVLIAYAFAFLPFPGRGTLFIVTLATMMIPFPVTMIVLYNLFRDLGWIGSFKPLWVPAWFGSAFFIFLLRQFFLSLPKELLDAARMDGCSELEILWHVVLPLSKPAIAMVALFTFLGCWSDYMGPLLYLSNKDSFTLALGLANYRGQHGGTEWNLLMAANLVFSLPLIILFLFTLKTFIKGIATTGMKG